MFRRKIYFADPEVEMEGGDDLLLFARAELYLQGTRLFN